MSTIPTTAKAWRFPPTEPSLWNSYHSLELKDVPVPKPGKGEVLVKMRAAALNARISKSAWVNTLAGHSPQVPTTADCS
ncbi:hypothetical protein RSAG8_13889, partial [Rhizoctonia solani AG-8 WAC10335]